MLAFHIGENSRYDLIADIDGILIRVQVKTSRYKDEEKNSIIFACRSSHTNSQGTKNVRYTKKEIDYFATYWNNECYLIPVEECSVEKTLRFSIPKNGQTKGISFANDYLLENILNKIKGGSN